MKEIIFILPALCCACFIINIIFYKKKAQTQLNKINWLYWSIFAIITGLQAINIFNFINDNFAINLVYSHSEKKLDVIHKITASFSGKEGSFLLWLTCIGIIGLFFNRQIKNIFDNSKNIFLCRAVFIVFPMFLSIALVWNNPFDLTSINTNITDGVGLKLTLQSYYNLIHPPLIFIGFSLLYIPYIISITTLLSKCKINDKIINGIDFFNRLGILFLSSGIIIGSLWAYRTLGWDGFWSWDAIENAALIPLLLSFVLLHFIIFNKKNIRKNNFLKVIFLLSILIFPTIILCTFLARSGLLIGNSVHSYSNSSGNIVIYIFLFLIVILLLSLILFFINIGVINSTNPKNKPTKEILKHASQVYYIELFNIVGIVILICIAFVMLCGTLIPILSNNIKIDANFYMLWSMPLATIMLILLGCSVLLKDKKYSFEKFANTIVAPFSGAIILMLLLFFNNMNKVEELIFSFACGFAVLTQIQALIIKIIKTKKVELKYFGAFLSHIGLAIFLVGAVLYGAFKEEEQIFLGKNKLFETHSKVRCIITDFDINYNKNDYYIVPKIKVEYKNNHFILQPKIVFESVNSSNSFFDVSMLPDIVSIGLTDIYFEPLNISTNTNNSQSMSLLISVKPYINLVWTGFIILVCGLFLCVISWNNNCKIIIK